MLSVEQAKAAILARGGRGAAEDVPAPHSAGRIVAAALAAPDSLPRFDNTAMDGYAVRSADTAAASETNGVRLRVVGASAPGEPAERAVAEGEAIRIMTGAPIPSGADAVAAQENVAETAEGGIEVRRPVPPGQHVRRRGEELREGDEVLSAGTRITPAGVGLLAMLGVQRVRVAAQPRVSIATTGNELVPAKAKPGPAQIRDSNGPALAAAIGELGFPPAWSVHLRDDPAEMHRYLRSLLDKSDFVVVTGGVSVGPRDHVKQTLAEAGVVDVLWRVAQKPGRPLYVGARGNTLVFGLPGNPASALVCFYEYLRPALLAWMGAKETEIPRLFLPLENEARGASGLTTFLKARLVSREGRAAVEVLPRQGSHMISSLAEGNCLVVLPGDAPVRRKGEMVEAHLLP